MLIHVYSDVLSLLAGALAPWLLEHYRDQVRKARSRPLPGAMRVSDGSPKGTFATDHRDLPECTLDGTASAFSRWLPQTAAAFRRWKWDRDNEYSRDVTQLLLISMPGAGAPAIIYVVCFHLLSPAGTCGMTVGGAALSAVVW